MIYIIILITVFLIAMMLPLKIAVMVLYPAKRTSEGIIESFTMEDWFDTGILKLNWEYFKFLSYDDTEICGQFFKGTAESCIIFSHGITGTRMSALRMLKPFLDAGWTIVLYDQRGHGESGGKYPAYGVKEKYDLRSLIKYIKKKYPDMEINLYGISMGAATVLQYLAVDGDIERCAADSSFFSLKEQLLFRFRCAGIPGVMHKAILLFAGLIIKIFGDFSVNDCNPARSAAAAGTPLLLMHAAEDQEVPADMCRAIADARKPGCKTEVFITDQGGHTESSVICRGEWMNIIKNFFEI